MEEKLAYPLIIINLLLTPSKELVIIKVYPRWANAVIHATSK